MSASPFRQLPSVNEVLQASSIQALASDWPHDRVVVAVREELASLREKLSRGEPLDGAVNIETLAGHVAERLARQFQPKLWPVINATGIVLHTNLGRAPVAEAAAKAAYEAARGYLNLELDLQSGKRSSRQLAIRERVCRLTGAESATAVNNNAAATVIALRALCKGKEAIISRGQLIEIGGSFRIPEIMEVSGATLREVGTTNITRLSDYEKAIGPATGALMRVHSSNYRISGFTESVPLTELVALGRKFALPVIDDIGSGALIDFSKFGFEDEPVARDSIAAGADLVLFSGDKLLGGPQAGILAGRKDLIQRIEQDPLMRAIRLDKMTLAALETTLRIYLNDERALVDIPTLRMLSTPLSELQSRAQSLANQLADINGLVGGVQEDTAYVGGGSLPDQAMATYVLAVQPVAMSDDDLAFRLRTGNPAVIARLKDGRLLFDLRTVFPRQEPALIDALRRAVTEAAPSNSSEK